jgi:hypothetical protein
MINLSIIFHLESKDYKETLTSIVEFSKKLTKENPDMLVHIEVQVNG